MRVPNWKESLKPLGSLSASYYLLMSWPCPTNPKTKWFRSHDSITSHQNIHHASVVLLSSMSFWSSYFNSWTTCSKFTATEKLMRDVLLIFYKFKRLCIGKHSTHLGPHPMPSAACFFSRKSFSVLFQLTSLKCHQTEISYSNKTYVDSVWAQIQFLNPQLHGFSWHLQVAQHFIELLSQNSLWRW